MMTIENRPYSSENTEKTTKTQYGLLTSMSDYHFGKQGKEIRRKLSELYGSLWQATEKDIKSWAQACEVLHNATLVLDDIQDNDELRRGQPSIWKKYGTSNAINLGTFLCVEAFESITECDSKYFKPLTKLLSTAAYETLLGQTLEFNHTYASTNHWSDYLHIIDNKTVPLLLAPIKGIAIMSPLKKIDILSTLHSWTLLSRVFQISDDIDDFTGQKQSNQKHKDFVENKFNSLVAYAKEHFKYDETSSLKNRLQFMNDNNITNHLLDVCETWTYQALESLGSIEQNFLSHFKHKTFGSVLTKASLKKASDHNYSLKNTSPSKKDTQRL